MNYGLYLSANGVLSNLYKQDVLANNLANVETVGFKADLVHLRQRAPERLESGRFFTDPKEMLEQLGGGHFANSTTVSLDQGNLQPSANPLDFAIEGEGFFVVSGPGGDATDPRLTRDGRFTLDAGGRLVLAATGARVLDTANQPVVLDKTGAIEVRGDGSIMQHGTEVARLRIDGATGSDLVKAGENLYRAGATTGPAPGVVRQGFVESSGVDPIMTLNQLIGVTKTAQANAKLMQYHDHIMGQAVGTFGRVA